MAWDRFSVSRLRIFPAGMLLPFSATHSRVGEGAGAAVPASSHYNKLLSPVLQDQRNRIPETRQTFVPRLTLSIGARHFGTISDVPGSVLLDNSRKLVAHAPILAL